jgi:hypothetical protein
VGCFAEGFLNAPGNAIRGAVKKVTDVISACGNLKPLECGEALVATQPIGMIVEYDASILAVDAAVVRGDWNSVACAAGGQTFWGAAAAVGVKVGGALKLGDAGVATGDGATGAAEEAGGAAESAGAAEVPAGEASGGGGGGGGIDEPYYHYTTSEGAAGIEASGQIVPGQEGLSWVSPTRYVDAATAQAELALPRTPSGYYQIPGSRISGLTRPSVVEADPPWPGGGIECTTTNSIDVGGLPFCVFP